MKSTTWLRTSLQIVREHYLRDDIYSGTPLDPECDAASHKLSPSAPHYLLIDTNIALHQVCAQFHYLSSTADGRSRNAFC